MSDLAKQKTEPVYAVIGERGWLLSKGVTRAFGENHIVHHKERGPVLAAVQPLPDHWDANNIDTSIAEEVGFIYVE